MARRAIGMLLVAMGLALLFLTAFGPSLPSAHPRHDRQKTHKAGLPVSNASETLARLAALEAEPVDAARLDEINRIVASAVVRYWPKPTEADADILRSFRENWLLASVQRLELAASGFLGSTPKLALYERRDYRAVVGKGVGLCSQAALAVADYLDRRGVPVEIVGLDGHVIAAAEIAGQSYLIDPDYGLLLPMSVAQAQREPRKVHEAYRTRGYSQEVAARIAAIYGAEGNKVSRPSDYMATAAFYTRLTELGLWGLPLLLVAGGVLLLRPRHNHKSVRTSVPSATR